MDETWISYLKDYKFDKQNPSMIYHIRTRFLGNMEYCFCYGNLDFVMVSGYLLEKILSHW